MQQKDTCCILCLGESTTAMQWPPFLDEILNKQDIGTSFSVIDKGVDGTNTNRILAELETNIEKYKPDMVITMIGVNDKGYYSEIANIRPGTLKNLRIYKLFKMILPLIKDKNQEVQAASIENIRQEENLTELTQINKLDNNSKHNFLNSDELNVKLQLDKPGDANEYVLMGRNYRDQGKYEQAIKYFEKALKINPENYDVCCELACCFMDQDELESAIKYFQKALKINPNDEWNYIGLAYCLIELGKHDEAENCFRAAIKINPENEDAYGGLGRFFRVQRRYEEAEKYFQKALEINQDDEWNYLGVADSLIDLGKYEEAENYFRSALKINPENGYAYEGLGRTCRKHGKYEEAEKYLQKALAIDPENEMFYNQLGLCFESQGKLEEAENCFRVALEINPEDKYAHEGLGKVCRRQGKYEEAEKCFKKVIAIDPKKEGIYEELGLSLMGQGKHQEAENSFLESRKITQMQGHRYYSPETINNYIKLKKTLEKNNVQYVCVQYPMWDVELLKDIFREESGIIFVDNKKIFEDAVNQSSYCEYFVDAFGGDFGHCTPKGNKLLAENIARVILKDCFGSDINFN